jgi:membrane-associated phospholipid phosphatase
MLRIAPLVLLALVIAAASVSAAIWDRWPGDLDGVRLLQSTANGATEPVLDLLNGIGATRGQVTLSAAGVVWLLYIHRRRQAAFLTMVVLSAALTTQLLKYLVDRPRPVLPDGLDVLGAASSPSFPSGHATFAAAYFGAIFILLAGSPHLTGRRRQVALALLAVLPVLVGAARVAWGVHWPSDVAGGFLVGLLAIFVAVAFFGRRPRIVD